MTDSHTDPATSVPAKPRRPWLAALLTLFATGLGQVYNGQWQKGVGFFVVELVFAWSMLFMWSDFVSMLLCISILVGFNLFAIGEAFATARKLRDFVPGRTNRWWVYVAFLCMSITLGMAFESVLSTKYHPYKIPSQSMLPTLLIGDHFVVDVLESGEEIRRGDIVTFKYPLDETKDFVKRVIGLPGETVELRNKVVFINGQSLDEPYVQHVEPDRIPVRDDFGPLKIGQGEYFMLGDNRDKSHDSRFVGTVRRDKITGRASYIYFPGIGNDGWSERLGMEIR